MGKCATEDKLSDIMKTQDWPTWNAQSVRSVSANASYEKHCHINEMEDKRHLGWVSGLVPIHQVIVVKTPGNHTIFFSLAVFEKSVLTWPVSRMGTTSLMLAKHANARPTWRSFFDMAELFVVPITPRSPMRVAAEHLEVSLDQISTVCHHGAPQELKAWQAEHGFANVKESVLRALHIALKVARPDDEEVAADVEASLSLSLVMHLMPDASESVVKHLMNHRVEVENDTVEEDNFEIPVDQDAFLDCCERNDQIASQKFAGKAAAAKATKATRRKNAKGLVEKRFFGKKKEAPAAAKIAKVLKKDKLKTKDDKDRWWASIRCDTDLILEYKPPTGNIFADNANGRVLVTYAGGKRKSISWTHRGMLAASREVLLQLWQWHEEATGEKRPDIPFF